MCSTRCKRYPESVEAVKKALALNPKPDDNLIRLLVADYLEMDKPQEAAKVLEDLLTRKPNDKALMINLASVYQQSDQDAKAGQVFDRMRAAGLLTESKDYENAYRLLANIDGREADALAIINEGLKKGILTAELRPVRLPGPGVLRPGQDRAGDRGLEQGRAAGQGRRDVLEPGQAAGR